ncbi:hypothetical protein C4K18_2600 [Pseudomonas chlororaphis subsp. aurantiaca]|nr:hypothetical protein C4K18_2600 [Pseudomonas chlororaphis subsp. aurantiaca]
MSQVLSMFSAAGPEKFSQMACQMAPTSAPSTR